MTELKLQSKICFIAKSSTGPLLYSAFVDKRKRGFRLFLFFFFLFYFGVCVFFFCFFFEMAKLTLKKIMIMLHITDNEVFRMFSYFRQKGSKFTEDSSMLYETYKLIRSRIIATVTYYSRTPIPRAPLEP